MPTPSEILAQSVAIAGHYWTLAFAWHVAVALVALAIVFGWRPTRRRGAQLALAPIVSAAVIAIDVGNPFNAIVLGAVAGALVVASLRIDDVTVAIGPPWSTITAGFLIAFGLGYPHFLPGASPFEYAVAAPVGLLPCPTLALAIGFALLTRGFGSKLWSGILAGAGLLYGAIGVMQLGVAIDLVLIAGSIALAVSLIPLVRWRGARAF